MPPLRHLVLCLFIPTLTLAQPLKTSWFTERSGQYARIYPTTDEETALTPVTRSKSGRGETGFSDQPRRNPAPKAPFCPPPDTAR